MAVEAVCVKVTAEWSRLSRRIVVFTNQEFAVLRWLVDQCEPAGFWMMCHKKTDISVVFCTQSDSVAVLDYAWSSFCHFGDSDCTAGSRGLLRKYCRADLLRKDREECVGGWREVTHTQTDARLRNRLANRVMGTALGWILLNTYVHVRGSRPACSYIRCCRPVSWPPKPSKRGGVAGWRVPMKLSNSSSTHAPTSQ